MTSSPTPATNNSSSKPYHKWVGPSGHHLIMVDVNGSGDFQSVQSVVNAVLVNNTVNIVILINPGCYIEKVGVLATKPYITFQGVGKRRLSNGMTVPVTLDPNGQQLRTYQTVSVTIFANYFSARNISFKHAPLPWQVVEQAVLDVGAGSGILAIWLTQARARKVYAVETTSMAEHARTVVKANNLQDVVEVIKGSMEDVVLPKKVDVIILEWMGYFLLRESMLDSVICARHQWLKPTGVIKAMDSRQLSL
ncbi:hypothetical protein ACFX19_044616 [Malus domestica]